MRVLQAISLMLCVLFRREQFLQWIENLPDTQTPSWLGLPNNAEKVLLTNKGRWSALMVILVYTSDLTVW